MKEKKNTERRNKQIHIISWGFQHNLSEQLTEQEKRKSVRIYDLNNLINQLAPTDIYIPFHPQGYMKHPWSFKKCIYFYEKVHVT